LKGREKFKKDIKAREDVNHLGNERSGHDGTNSLDFVFESGNEGGNLQNLRQLLGRGRGNSKKQPDDKGRKRAFRTKKNKNGHKKAWNEINLPKREKREERKQLRRENTCVGEGPLLRETKGIALSGKGGLLIGERRWVKRITRKWRTGTLRESMRAGGT